MSTPQEPSTGTEIVRREFGAEQTMAVAETSALALAEREKATIQAMFILAAQRPRSIERFEAGIVAECKRPGFADIARYCKPVGKKWNPDTSQNEQQFAEGWSIRFAEAAMRHFTNVFFDAKSAYEDDSKRIVRMVVMDLESNITISSELNLSKRVERKGFKKGNQVMPPAGREVLGERLNSYNEKVYIVEATDDELNMKQASQWSKFMRNVIKFMPGDILDRCEVAIAETLSRLTPKEQIDKLIVAFGRLNIKPVDLQVYLGHAIDITTVQELDDLRKVHTAIKDGECTWAQVLEARHPHGGGSKEEQDRVAAEKLEVLKKAGENQPPAQTENAEMPEQGDGATGAGEPPTSVTHLDLTSEQRAISHYRPTVGDKEFIQILGNNGCESIADVSEKNWKVIAKECEAVIASKRAEEAPPQQTEAPPARPKPVFGKKDSK